MANDERDSSPSPPPHSGGGGMSRSGRLFTPPAPCDSWCHTTVSENKEFNYLWTIENFEKIVETYPNSKTMYSEQFVIPLRKKFTIWRLKIYPTGRTAEDQGYITIFLKDSGQTSPANVRAVAEFSIIDIFGNRTNIKSVDKEFRVFNHSFGFNKFVKHQDLFSHGSTLLNSGNLTLGCKITIKLSDTVNETNVHSEYLEADEPVESIDNSSFFRHMKNLLINAEDNFSDVVIKCSDGEIACHSSILAARSPYFKAMFSMPLKESLTRIIKIEEFDKKFMMLLLEHIYTGKCDPDLITLNLLEAADQYNLLDLKDQCCKYLMRHITRENCIQTLIVADRHSAKELRSAAKDFMMENCDLFAASSEWKDELRSHPSLLTELLEGVVFTHPQCKRTWIEVGEENGEPVAKRRRGGKSTRGERGDGARASDLVISLN